jgi:glucose/arabinose dehydrogenase
MSKQRYGVIFCCITLLTASLFSGRVGADRVPSTQQAPAAIQLEPVVGGLTSPVHVTSAKDGTNRLFIVEQPGRILVLQPGASSPTVFLNITSRVLSDGNEQGLLGLAFHPQFNVNHRFFVNYTRQTDGATVVAEYHASPSNPNVASTAETPLLTIQQPFPNHNGGMIAFGPDGFLYIGMGDGGSANDPDNRAQNIDDLLGKILRIDVDHAAGSVPYSSPSSNPFFGPTAGRDEIYALGTRNPWRFSFDRGGSHQLYVGDVGQGAREEVDIVTLGGNYGWRVMEGSICNPNFNGGACTPPPGSILPITEYSHTNGRCSITGGYVYRGARSALPTGTYVYGDYCTGEIFTLQNGAQMLLLDAQLRISSFGEDEAGEIYVVGLLSGTVDRISASPAFPPCEFSLSPKSQSFPASGGTGTIVVTTSGDCNWIAASTVNWINITGGSSATGSVPIHYSVAANTGQSPRAGKINVAGLVFTITQAAQSATPTLSSLRLSTANIPGCQSLTGTVTLGAPAPDGGAIVTLSDNLAAAKTPASVTIPAGATSKTFTITTTPVTSTQNGSVTAQLGAVTKSVALRVRPIGVQTLTLNPNPVVGPNPVTGTVTLECPAPAGGITVSLSSSNPTVAAPTASSLTIPARVRSKTFTIRTINVPASRTAIIKATANGISKSVTLTIN